MKSTKYQLLEDDFNHACEQSRIYKKVIDELRKENATLKWNNSNLLNNGTYERLDKFEKALRDIAVNCDNPTFKYVAKKALEV